MIFLFIVVEKAVLASEPVALSIMEHLGLKNGQNKVI